jgi:uncharacterized protein YabN with tetrapyrrole methylase and pyrophosphatase domain
MVGELLFQVVNIARSTGIDPEAALRATAVRFRDRFTAVERLAAERGIDLRAVGSDAVVALWEELQADSA